MCLKQGNKIVKNGITTNTIMQYKTLLNLKHLLIEIFIYAFAKCAVKA